MSCKSCKDKIRGYCKVCQLLDNDNKIKLVTYCDVCKVYICEKCNNNWIKRVEAFLKHNFQ